MQLSSLGSAVYAALLSPALLLIFLGTSTLPHPVCAQHPCMEPMETWRWEGGMQLPLGGRRSCGLGTSDHIMYFGEEKILSFVSLLRFNSVNKICCGDLVCV